MLRPQDTAFNERACTCKYTHVHCRIIYTGRYAHRRTVYSGPRAGNREKQKSIETFARENVPVEFVRIVLMICTHGECEFYARKPTRCIR